MRLASASSTFPIRTIYYFGVVYQQFVPQLLGQRTGLHAVVGRRVELEMAVMPRQSSISPCPGPHTAGGVRNVAVFPDHTVAAFHIDRFVVYDIVQFADRRVDLAVEIVPAAGRKECGSGKQQAAEASVHGKWRVSMRQDNKIRHQNHAPEDFSGVTTRLHSLIKQTRFTHNPLTINSLHFRRV